MHSLKWLEHHHSHPCLGVLGAWTTLIETSNSTTCMLHLILWCIDFAQLSLYYSMHRHIYLCMLLQGRDVSGQRILHGC